MRAEWVAVPALGLALAGCVPSQAPPVEATAVSTSGDGTVLTTTLWSATHVWLLDDDGNLGRSGASDPTPGPARTEDCAGEVCYRVVPGALRVEQSNDGGDNYDTVWQISGHTYQRLARDYDDLGDPATHLSSRAVAVRTVPGGHIVYVANGRDGVLYRDVTGGWHRIGIPDCAEGCYLAEPPRLVTDPKPFDPTPYVAALATLMVLLAGGVTAVLRGSLRPGNGTAILGLAAVAGFVGGLAVHTPAVGMFPGTLYGGLIFVFTVSAAGAAAAVLGARRLHRAEYEADPPWPEHPIDAATKPHDANQ